MNKKRIVIFVIIAISISYFFLSKGNYQWNSPEDKIRYSNASWNKITSSRINGFASSTELTENKTEPCKAGDNKNVNYLRIEGGLCGTGYWLEIKHESLIEKIDSLEKLKEAFGPIDNEIKAASFIAVITDDLKVNRGDIVEGHTSTVSDGYLVQVVKKNTFGCGSHEPTGVIYKVLKSGEVQQIALEKKLDLSFGLRMCVD